MCIKKVFGASSLPAALGLAVQAAALLKAGQAAAAVPFARRCVALLSSFENAAHEVLREG
jgi:hypothetical protein